MQKPSFDPGITQQFSSPVSRIINPDGSFNVRRRGSTWRDFHPYLLLINMSWPPFLVVLFLGVPGVEHAVRAGRITRSERSSCRASTDRRPWRRFLDTFFFSAHTLTTVGYGSIAPKGLGANIVAAFEALIGVHGVRRRDGAAFRAVSRPSARIGFSENMVVRRLSGRHEPAVPRRQPAAKLADGTGGPGHADDGRACRTESQSAPIS